MRTETEGLYNTHKNRAVMYGTCCDCGQRYQAGSWIVQMAIRKFRHLECPHAT